MYQVLRPLLFLNGAETAHNLTLRALRNAERIGINPWKQAFYDRQPVTVMGLTFPSRVGLAAGMDKDGECIDGFGALGFGFLELGTVTPRPQPGNPKPRLFRIPSKQAIINRMGFNNKGAAHLVEQIQRARFRGIIGVNIGKNKDTPLENAHEDYLACLTQVYGCADYIAVNVSSPNTAGLRSLQAADYLRRLLELLLQQRSILQQEHQRFVPIAVKLAPDLSDDELASIVGVLNESGIDGVIATNTTISKDEVASLPHGNEQGGLSGRPLTQQAQQILYAVRSLLSSTIPVIAVGGIMNGTDAQERVKAGAALVQLYTGLIYRGPQLVREVNEAIVACEDVPMSSCEA